MPELNEISLGTWQGRRFDTVKTLHPTAFEQRGKDIANHRPPEGEPFRDLLNRVWPIFMSVVGRPRTKMLVVTHAGGIRVLLCRLLGMPLDNLFSIGQAYGALNIIHLRPENYRVQALNLQLPIPLGLRS